MKKITLAALASSLLILTGMALAQQPAGQKERPPMPGMMQQMMGGETGGGGMGGMGGMMGMMRMMGQMTKMTDQCIATHESIHSESGQSQEGRQK